EREAQAGDEVELARDGAGYRVVSRQARDADAIDTAFLSERGRVFALPRLPEHASVTAAGHGALPSSLVAIRTQVAVGLQARAGGCGLSQAGWIAVDPNADGTVSSPRVHGIDSRPLATCIERQALSLRMPPLLRNGQQTIDVHRPH